MVITVIPSTIIHLFFNSSPLLYDFLFVGLFYHMLEIFTFFFFSLLIVSELYKNSFISVQKSQFFCKLLRYACSTAL
ncbi:hypothetical protein D8X84_11085 [Listeria innocua]|nr:hypothetical protein [Listeria innocua]